MRSKQGWGLIFTAALFLVAVGASPPAPAGAAAPAGQEPAAVPEIRKKVIELGWDMPTTSYVREHLKEMEATTPFDGITIQVEAKGDREKMMCTKKTIWQNWRWQREWFKDALADLKACEFKQFTDNFLSVSACPGNVDWFDDQGWAAVANNVAIMAWLAKEGGMKGLAFDPETYQHNQFQYYANEKHAFMETYRMARQRGGQIMRAMAREYPGITFWGYWLNSIALKQITSPDTMRALSDFRWGLYPAFVDGLLDALPPQAKLVDATENAYTFDSEKDFLLQYFMIKNLALKLVSPENRRKYRAQVQAGFGLYLDPYLNRKGVYHYIGGRGGPRVDRFRHNLATALRVADEYVWVYGEQCKWWPITMSAWKEKQVKATPGGGRLWEEALPGVTAAIRVARDPIAFAHKRIAELRATGKLENLVANPGFESSTAKAESEQGINWKKGAAPAGWRSWQRTKSRKYPQPGTLTWDQSFGFESKGSAKAAGVFEGCFIYSRNVKPGETYVVEALALAQGKIKCGVEVRWHDENGKWIERFHGRPLPLKETDSAWKKAWGLILVPQKARRLIIILGSGVQVKNRWRRPKPEPEDVCWFDDIGLYRLTLLP